MEKAKGLLLDIDSFVDEKNEIGLRLHVKTGNGVKVFPEKKFKPYFYIIADDSKKRQTEAEKIRFGENGFSAIKVEPESKKNAENVLKLFFKNTDELKTARDEITRHSFVLEKREYDIPFAKRYLIDKGLRPLDGIEIEYEKENGIVSAKAFEAGEKEIQALKVLAFDLETYSPGRFSDPSKDPVISAAVCTREKCSVFAWKKDGKKALGFLENEHGVIEALAKEIETEKPDIIVTYNGDNFDFPYLIERAKKLKVDIRKAFGNHEPRSKKMGLDSAVRIAGIQHMDAYKSIRILNRFGVTSLVKFDLESVVEKLFLQKKEKVSNIEINEAFETGNGMQRMLDYNREDAQMTLRLALEFLPLFIETSRLVRETLFDSSRQSASSLVEDLLMIKAFEESLLVPNRPDEGEVKRRMLQSFKGGYVKEPLPGLHENIAVLDFRSLHPSIMIAHNVSPETLKCTHTECMGGKNVSPDHDWFCEKTKGFIPSVVEKILKTRVSAKELMKKLGEKNEGYRFVKAKQQALKILLNSHYGYLGYPRSRWYSRESAKAVTAWSRHYIRDITNQAEEHGFTSLYNDTDSCFLLVPKGKTKEDVLTFTKKINSDLPGSMELEFEGYYKRGIFVTKREGGAAKKRYALLDFNGNLKIVGFEYVRRDWAKIAKDTQREVIEAVLEVGDPKKAIEIVREKIRRLREGKAEKKELIVLTQLKKPIKKYESIGPHVAAAIKAEQRGKEIGVGSTLEFIITKNGKSISDKAELAEYVKEGNYDAEYYVEHQVIPAVIRIISELGVSKEDLIHGGKQHSLSSFM